MRRDTRFRRPERSELESKLPFNVSDDPQAVGIWSMMLQSDDPSEVTRWYRTYRDSQHCSLPVEKLRIMRDTMITAMRESNRQDPKPRVEKHKGRHYVAIDEWYRPERKGA